MAMNNFPELVRAACYSAMALCMLYIFQYSQRRRWLALGLAIFFTVALIAVALSAAGLEEARAILLDIHTPVTVAVTIIALIYIARHKRSGLWD